MFRRPLHGFARRLERAVDALSARLEERSGGLGPLEALVYRGHGNAREAVVRGRVLADRRLPVARLEDTVLHNLLAAYRRFETDEVPDTRILVRGRGLEVESATDAKGYFQVRLSGGDPGPAGSGWESAQVVVPDQPERGLLGVRATALFRVPGDDARLGVISDVDDTVLRTGATSLLAIAHHTLLHNARTRLPFPGVAALYRALEAGGSGREANPVFYVSSSPWNLYDLLLEFLDLQDLPAGPLFLQDLGVDAALGRSPHRAHKLARIEEILSLHPQLPFVLSGDSGQEDPEVYREVVRRHPGRILGIYIRQASAEGRDRVVVEIGDRLRAEGVDMVLVSDSLEAARHAAERGWIAPESPDAVAEELRRGG